MNQAEPPAFRLYVLRHAQAAWAEPGQTDFDRCLTVAGLRQAETIARLAREKGMSPDHVICSTAMRCRQTLAPWQVAVQANATISYDDALYAGTVETYLERLCETSTASSLMIVGHNPMIEAFVHAIADEASLAPDLLLGFPPAGLAIVDFPVHPVPGSKPQGRLVGWHSVSGS